MDVFPKHEPCQSVIEALERQGWKVYGEGFWWINPTTIHCQIFCGKTEPTLQLPVTREVILSVDSEYNVIRADVRFSSATDFYNHYSQ